MLGKSNKKPRAMQIYLESVRIFSKVLCDIVPAGVGKSRTKIIYPGMANDVFVPNRRSLPFMVLTKLCEPE